MASWSFRSFSGILEAVRLIDLSFSVFPNLGSLRINTPGHIERESLLLRFQFSLLFPQDQFGLLGLSEFLSFSAACSAKIGQLRLDVRAHLL